MRLTISRSKNSASYYVIKTIYINGKEKTEIVEKLGTPLCQDSCRRVLSKV